MARAWQGGKNTELVLSKARAGALLWSSGLRIWHCHCYGMGSIPGLGTFTYCGYSRKKKKKARADQIHVGASLGSLTAS